MSHLALELAQMHSRAARVPGYGGFFSGGLAWGTELGFHFNGCVETAFVEFSDSGFVSS